MPWGDRFVYLFATLREKGVKKLVYSRYDLEKRNWDTEPSELDLPDDASEFSAVLLQAIDETTAPQLLLKLRKSSKAGSEHLYGILYHRKLNEAASDWADEDWRPLTTPALGNALGEPVAWVQTASDAGCVLVQDAANGISYRLFAPNDDGHWQRSNGGFFADFRGAFRWPGTPDAYVASVWVGSTAGAAIKTAQRTVELTPVDTLEKVETWLNDVAGLSLKGVHTETMFGTLSLYDLMNLDFDAVLAPAFINVDPVYRVLSPAAAQYTDEVFGTLFRLQQFCALLGFVGKVEGATDFRDKDFGAWQIAHGLARYLSDRKGGLFELIAGVLPNWPGSDYYIFSTGTPLRLKQTNSDFHAEFPGSFTLLPYDCTVFHANGSPPNEFRQFGFRSIDKAGGFRGTLSRSGDNLEPSPFIPIAPAVTGPLDIKQRLSDAKLQTRAAQIKNAVIANLERSALQPQLSRRGLLLRSSPSRAAAAGPRRIHGRSGLVPQRLRLCDAPEPAQDLLRPGAGGEGQDGLPACSRLAARSAQSARDRRHPAAHLFALHHHVDCTLPARLRRRRIYARHARNGRPRARALSCRARPARYRRAAPEAWTLR
jgi:hypothetical protein